MQLLDALKVMVQPWKWFGAQYVAVQGQFADDASYLNPRGGRKNQIAAL